MFKNKKIILKQIMRKVKNILIAFFFITIFQNMVFAEHSTNKRESFAITHIKKDLHLNINCTDTDGQKSYFGVQEVILDSSANIFVMSRKDQNNLYTKPKSIVFTDFNGKYNVLGKAYSGLIKFYDYYDDFPSPTENKKSI